MRLLANNSSVSILTENARNKISSEFNLNIEYQKMAMTLEGNL
ncbi:hypothetical protein SB6421_03817 [Klebsiella huaxiensis]|nr:hypothetical protein SB6421_03817 [Klebsiella huaxiensis]